MGPEFAVALEAAAPYLVAGGTAASIYGQHQQERQQKQILNRAYDQTDKDQQQGNAKVLQEAQSMAPTQRAADLKAAEDAAFARIQGDTAPAVGAGGAAIGTSQPGGTVVSSDFLKAKADSALAEGGRQTAIARELAKVRSVGNVVQDETQRRSALAESLGSMWNTDKAGARAATLDAQDVGTPMIGQLGQIASLAGMAGGMMGPAAGAAGGAGVSGMDLAADAATGTGNNIVTAGQMVPTANMIPMNAAAAAGRTPHWWEQMGQVSPMFAHRRTGWAGR